MASKGRKSKLQIEARLGEVEQRMIRMRSYYQVEQWIVAQPWGISERQARRYIEQVKARWRAEAREDDRDVLRRDMHVTLNLGVNLALNRTQVVKDANGDPVLDPTTTQVDSAGKVVAGKPLVRPNPDLQRMFYGLAQLRALHGLDEPVKAKIEIDGDLSVSKEVNDLPPEAFDALRQVIAKLAPDGDIDALIGDWLGDGKKTT